MMYTISLPIPVFRQDTHRFLVPAGLARDILAHSRYVDHVRLICPAADAPGAVTDAQSIDLRRSSRLSFRLLPWNGSRLRFALNYFAMRSILAEEARKADVWHTGCSIGLWDLSRLSYAVGRRFARDLRVVCLDSDPASMLAASGGLGAVQARLIRARYRTQLRDADAAIFVGSGAEQTYASWARRFVTTDAVWLQEGELAEPAQVAAKHADAGPIRIALPSRLTAWKGVDDAIRALLSLGGEAPRWQLDVMGDGPERARLAALATDAPCTVRFLAPIPYGERFLHALRGYHVVIAPTRGLEQTRIVFDALACGCVLVHSATRTLESALSGFASRWSFAPGNVEALSAALEDCFATRASWHRCAAAGIEFMRGRTIDEMHRLRARFLAELTRAERNSAAESLPTALTQPVRPVWRRARPRRSPAAPAAERN